LHCSIKFKTGFSSEKLISYFHVALGREQLGNAMANLARKESVAYFLRFLGVFALYFVAGKLGLSAPFTSGNVSPFWPASGIALASVMLWGYSIWPAIVTAAFFVNFWSPIPFKAAVGIAVGNTVAALFGGFLLRRFANVNVTLDRLRDVIAVLTLGAFVSPLLAATVGTLTLSLTHVRAWSGLGTALPVWWLGDGMGVLVAAPLLLTVRHARSTFRQVASAEMFSVFAGGGVVALLIFSRTLGQFITDDVLAFAVFPFVIWAAIRFRLVGVSMLCFLLAIIAVWGTAHGDGPFVKHDPVHNAILLQLFLAVLSISGLSLAAVTSERSKAESALRTLSGRLLQLQDDERRRLARELHDSSGQHLVALQMTLATLSQRLPQGEHSHLVADSQTILERAVKEIRTLSYLLYPPLLDEAGLPSALRWYVDGLAQRSHLRIDLHFCPNFGRLTQELEATIFRIVQESLTNVHRHSGSSLARINLVRYRNHIALTIWDEGKGIGLDLAGDQALNSPSLGVGIRGIAERVRDLNGSLRIREMVPGTMIEVKLPLHARDSKIKNDATAAGQ
jgi:signal transduction histidine kinase